MSIRKVAPLAAAALVLVAFFLLKHRAAGRPAAARNLVVITLDTTRADRIGCYGSRDVATPHLDELAARGVLFENAISPTPLTLPAHSSLFTGQEPGGHGVRDNGGFRLADERTTLAEALAAAGFKTGGFVSAYVLDHRWGIAQGFSTYFDDFDLSKLKTISMGQIQRRGDETVARALDWLRSAASRRFFCWIHLYDPHSPYEPPEPYASRYAGRPYDGEIAWTDELVGRVVGALDAAGLSDRTIVAVVGDHGESLGEHGETGHGYYIYEQTTRVPLILAAPGTGRSGLRVKEVVRHVDFTPTLLDLLGVPVPPAKLQGRSLVPLMLGGSDGGPEGYSESFYARFHYGWSELRAVRTDRWHFIESPRPELYDVRADPAELTNVVGREPSVLEEMRAALARVEEGIGEAPAAPPPVEEDEETLRKLAALGYVGSTDVSHGKSWRDLPDPKDRIDVYNLMNRAREEMQAGRPDDAIATLHDVLAQDPEVIDAWYTLGNAYYRKRDWKQAAENYRKTLDKKPDHDYAMVCLADTMVAEGRVDDAILGYRKFLEQDPKNAQILYRLAQVLLDANRDTESEQAFHQTLAVEPKTAQAEIGLGILAFNRKDVPGAQAAVARALAIDPKARNAHYNLALLAEARGDLREAESEYRAEIALWPEAFKALFNLARLQKRAGDARGAVETFRRAVDARPDFAVGRFFLAQALLAAGDLEPAMKEAREALDKAPDSEFAPLGHFVLADALNRLGRHAEAEKEVRKGKEAESRTRAPAKLPEDD